jgi:hypothetical protein
VLKIITRRQFSIIFYIFADNLKEPVFGWTTDEELQKRNKPCNFFATFVVYPNKRSGRRWWEAKQRRGKKNRRPCNFFATSAVYPSKSSGKRRRKQNKGEAKKIDAHATFLRLLSSI